MCKSTVSGILSILLMLQMTACSQKHTATFDSVPSALTPGIFWQDTRALIPEGTVLTEVYAPGIELTKTSEGFRSKLYNDAAGYCTIGYGHLIKKKACNGTELQQFLAGISEAHGERLLVSDMDWAKYTVMNSVSVQLTEGQYAALVDFVFNVGSGNFNKSTLRKKVNNQQHAEVPVQFRRWVRAGGKVWGGLVTRRESEIDLYLEDTALPRLLPPDSEEVMTIDIREGEQNP